MKMKLGAKQDLDSKKILDPNVKTIIKKLKAPTDNIHQYINSGVETVKR